MVQRGRAAKPERRGRSIRRRQLRFRERWAARTDGFGNYKANSVLVPLRDPDVGIDPWKAGGEDGWGLTFQQLAERQVFQQQLAARCGFRLRETKDMDDAGIASVLENLANTLDAVIEAFPRESTMLAKMASMVNAFVQSGGNTAGVLPHIALMGDPGIGKTLLAELLGKALSQLGVLTYRDFKTVNKTDFVGQYLGQTGPKTLRLLNSSLERVVFFDEAYALTQGIKSDDPDGGGNLYGQEAVDELVPFLWDNRGNFVMIIAGYQDKIQNDFLGANAASRAASGCRSSSTRTRCRRWSRFRRTPSTAACARTTVRRRRSTASPIGRAS